MSEITDDDRAWFRGALFAFASVKDSPLPIDAAYDAGVRALGIPAATLRGLRDGSLVAVPHDPTEAMLDAAQDEQVGCCTPTQREARIIYQVMLAAVQKDPPHD